MGELQLPYTVPLALGIGSGLKVGAGQGSPVTSRYSLPFTFTGTIRSVTVDISGELLHETEEAEKAMAKVALARQ